MSVLITGASGFIGYHLSKKLIELNNTVIGIDNFNSYYDPTLKYSRDKNLKKISSNFSFGSYISIKEELENNKKLEEIFASYKPKIVINLAAQAGVRYSIENPSAYIQSNLVGFGNILELSKKFKVNHLIYASSSSVYGGNKNMPFSESNGVDHPVSLYAATKKSNELMAHVYSHLFDLPTTGLRFFTVYGPWGRPDMALFLFTKSIIEGKPIKVFNNGDMIRDFTYVDDIVESIIRLIKKSPKKNSDFDLMKPNPSKSWAPYRIFNIGNSNPVSLMDYISAIEDALCKKAIKEYLPMQPGDVSETSANTKLLEDWVDFRPNTSVKDGILNFVNWYKDYYKI